MRNLYEIGRVFVLCAIVITLAAGFLYGITLLGIWAMGLSPILGIAVIIVACSLVLTAVFFAAEILG